jgi:hypothetical protein
MRYLIFIVLLLKYGSCFSQSDTEIIVKFSDLSVIFRKMDTFSVTYLNVRADTAYLEMDPGTIVENTVMSISASESDVKLFQRFETSLGISHEGPHCDLKAWKHFVSRWQKLKFSDSKKTFRPISYSEKEKENFPHVSAKEVAEALEAHCDSRWAEYGKLFSSPVKYPFSVSISKYYFRLEYRDKVSRKLKQKIIVLAMPMGC